MATVKNIIFDLGGVLLNIDYHKTAAAFKNLGAADFDDFYSQAAANHLFEALETGNISENDFYEAMQQHCNPGITFRQIETAWNAILLDFRKESICFLSSVKERYNIFLLSNTNSIHHTAFHKSFAEEIGNLPFDNFFVKAYYSHLINKRKPYPSTYQYVLDDAGITAAETLFVDDSVVNIKGAADVGLHTHLLLPDERIETMGW